VDVVISGVPFDLATTERPGARFGPASIRQASAHLAWEIHRWPWDFHVLKEIKRIVGEHPAYVTFDIDCLDPAFAPGTGTPVVGGLSTHSALKITRGLVGCNLIGMDIVEVCPPYDYAEITALAAATLGLEFLYVLAANKTVKLNKA